MARDYSGYSDEKLISIIKELERQLKETKYGLFWNTNIETDEELLKIKSNFPYLERDIDKTILCSGKENNILIEGDNITSLTVLNTIGEESIDIIYIDPPYNTGNKDFIYCDKYVDEEDGYRHSKWLSFMKTRIELSRNLLKDTGLIFISIDEHEVFQLKLLMDSIYGEKNYVENFIWIKNSTKNLSKTTSTNHEYILCYAKNIKNIADKGFFRVDKPGINEVSSLLEKANNEDWTVERTERELREFYRNNPSLKGISSYDRVENRFDENAGRMRLRAYTLDNASAPKAKGTADCYPVIHPKTGRACKTPTRGWAFTRSKMEQLIQNNLIYFYEDETKVPRYKRFLDTVTTEVAKSYFENFDDGKKQLIQVFNSNNVFENSKPVSLMKHILKFVPSKEVTVLDFFAGSGTMGQAVLELNQEDGGHRKFIMCTNNENDICTSITFPRIKTIITGKRKDGSMYSNGIDSNLIYYKTNFISDKENSDQAKYNLVEKVDELLCILEDIYNRIEKTNCYSHYASSDGLKHLFIYNDIYQKEQFELFRYMINYYSGTKVVYVYSGDNNVDESLFEELSDVEFKPIPSKIYEIYKEIVEDIKRSEE